VPEHRLYASLARSTDMASSIESPVMKSVSELLKSPAQRNKRSVLCQPASLSAGVRAGPRRRECMSGFERTPLTAQDRLQWLEEGPNQSINSLQV
jgi:hypothetical protein